MKALAYWIEGPWRGRLAIVPRPRGGDWLEDEVRAWRDARINLVVSMLQSDESAELDIAAEALLCKANGIAAARGCPVPDTAEQRKWVARWSLEMVRLGVK